MANAKNTLMTLIESAANPKTGFGTVKTSNVALPQATQVCFFDRTKPLETIDPEIYKINLLYPEDNIIVLGKDPLFAVKAPKLRLEKNPLCIKIPTSTVIITLETQANSALLTSSLEQVKSSCIILKQTQEPENALDIVFIPHGYRDEESFNADAEAFTQNAFKGIAPFNLDHMNFFRTALEPLDCKSKGVLLCDDEQARLLAKNCPHDVIAILHRRNPTVEALFHLRSSALGIVVALNTVDEKTVLAHELGHIVGHLADEYVDEFYYSAFNEADYPNCDSQPCIEWRNIQGTSCFAGCAKGEYYRSTQNSLMRDLGFPVFGPLNENIMRSEFARYENGTQ